MCNDVQLVTNGGIECDKDGVAGQGEVASLGGLPTGIPDGHRRQLISTENCGGGFIEVAEMLPKCAHSIHLREGECEVQETLLGGCRAFRVECFC
jgi:hypothetical protein